MALDYNTAKIEDLHQGITVNAQNPAQIKLADTLLLSYRQQIIIEAEIGLRESRNGPEAERAAVMQTRAELRRAMVALHAAVDWEYSLTPQAKAERDARIKQQSQEPACDDIPSSRVA